MIETISQLANVVVLVPILEATNQCYCKIETGKHFIYDYMICVIFLFGSSTFHEHPHTRNLQNIGGSFTDPRSCFTGSFPSEIGIANW